jgi:hypothetical protein
MVAAAVAMLGIAGGTATARAEGAGLPEMLDRQVFSSSYPWKRQIRTTTFYIGQGSLASVPGSSANRDSAWDRQWRENYGGTDDPRRRSGFRPTAFVPRLNPFYVALPFNDVAYPASAQRFIPWFNERIAHARSTAHRSVVKGQWLAIHYRGRVCFAQWEDVGPWTTHSPEYVFGNGRPTGRAGLDVSPAVRDFLRFPDTTYTDWRFVDVTEVPDGPWLQFGRTRQERTEEMARLGRDPRRQVVTEKRFGETVRRFGG